MAIQRLTQPHVQLTECMRRKPDCEIPEWVEHIETAPVTPEAPGTSEAFQLKSTVLREVTSLLQFDERFMDGSPGKGSVAVEDESQVLDLRKLSERTIATEYGIILRPEPSRASWISEGALLHSPGTDNLEEGLGFGKIHLVDHPDPPLPSHSGILKERVYGYGQAVAVNPQDPDQQIPVKLFYCSIENPIAAEGTLDGQGILKGRTIERAVVVEYPDHHLGYGTNSEWIAVK
ncbi:MAG: hypothetical protein HYU64_00405 [Armatimonadetes bacterium]|nr:hypothetical protein [Armatimonadota bacterium]